MAKNKRNNNHQTEIINARPALPTLIFVFLLLASFATSNAQPFVPGDEAIGRWNLTFETAEGTSPGWLEIKKSGFRTLTGSYVGAEGSARPISHVIYSEENETYSFSIPPQWKNQERYLEFEFILEDEIIKGNALIGNERFPMTGKRAPDLHRDAPTVWGEPYSLIDEHMSHWVIPKNNRFQMRDGVLVNEDVGGNLVTNEVFDDLKLHATFRYPEGSNSGIYLRGRYEVQIIDSYGEPVNDLILGGIYGFLEPSVNAGKKAGEWQTMDITFIGRHVTVVLNGTTIINNRIIPGITGGALDSNEGEPGPIMIQGDHGPVEFKKLIITPAIN